MKCFNVQRLLAAVFVLLTLVMSTACSAKNRALVQPLGDVQTGDLIFLDIDCGDICQAIENVTKEQFGVDGPDLNHVGILEISEGHNVFVLEAWPESGVQRISLSRFLSRVKQGENVEHGFYVGRFQKEFRNAARRAVKKAKKNLSKPYNETFLPSGESFYCSSLVSDSFDQGFFQTSLMTFGKEGSADRKIWENYYSKLKMKIPDGLPGISPLGIWLQGKAKYFK